MLAGVEVSCSIKFGIACSYVNNQTIGSNIWLSWLLATSPFSPILFGIITIVDFSTADPPVTLPLAAFTGAACTSLIGKTCLIVSFFFFSDYNTSVLLVITSVADSIQRLLY